MKHGIFSKGECTTTLPKSALVVVVIGGRSVLCVSSRSACLLSARILSLILSTCACDCVTPLHLFTSLIQSILCVSSRSACLLSACILPLILSTYLCDCVIPLYLFTSRVQSILCVSSCSACLLSACILPLILSTYLSKCMPPFCLFTSLVYLAVCLLVIFCLFVLTVTGYSCEVVKVMNDSGSNGSWYLMPKQQ